MNGETHSLTRAPFLLLWLGAGAGARCGCDLLASWPGRRPRLAGLLFGSSGRERSRGSATSAAGSSRGGRSARGSQRRGAAPGAEKVPLARSLAPRRGPRAAARLPPPPAASGGRRRLSREVAAPPALAAFTGAQPRARAAWRGEGAAPLAAAGALGSGGAPGDATRPRRRRRALRRARAPRAQSSTGWTLAPGRVTKLMSRRRSSERK